MSEITFTTHHASGPCGDTMTVHLRADGERILAINGESDGCGASWLAIAKCCQLAEGLGLREAAARIRPEQIAESCELPDDHLHCARLAVTTLRAAVDARLTAAQPASESSCCGQGGADSAACDCAQEQSGCSGDCGDCGASCSGKDGIGRVILVCSGKGGVGKSSVAAGLASALAAKDLRIGLLDADVHGPSLPRIMDLRGQALCHSGETLLPQMSMGGVQVCSSGLLAADPHQAFIQRGPAKSGLILSMLRDIAWGHLDVLVVDLPPGTGDEALTVAQHFTGRATALLVTTPHELALDDARRCLGFCRRLELPLLGVVENMAGFRCPDCGAVHDIFAGQAGTTLAREAGCPLLGHLPLDPALAVAGECGWSHDLPLGAIAERLRNDLHLDRPHCPVAG